MCKKTKISKCEAIAFCTWLKTPEGKAETLKIITDNVKFQQILCGLIGGCCKTNCNTLKQLIKAARKLLFDTWKALQIPQLVNPTKKTKE
jgi:hypothetical protein